MMEKFANGTFQLADLDNTPHEARVNGYMLKKYVARLMTVVGDKEIENRMSVGPLLTIEEDYGPAIVDMFDSC